MRVICEKMSTREPCACSLGSSLSSSTILPHASQMCGPSKYGGPGSAPSNRYGWLHTLRSCISVLSRRVRSGPPCALSANASLFSTCLYSAFCCGVRPMKSFVSVLGGSDRSTSALSRRSRNGRSTACSLRMTSWSAAAPGLNHVSKSSDDAKMSGSRKLSSAHSSCRLFCSGVPVSSRRNSELSSRTRRASSEFSFLMRCASSMMT